MTADTDAERRVLVLAPSGMDAAVIEKLLGRIGLAARVCPQAEALARELRAGAGAVIVAEEALGEPELERLTAAIASQPEWSDLPLILLTVAGHDPSRLVDRLWDSAKSRAVVLERPTRSTTLFAAVQAALRARLRQYQIRDELVRRRAMERALLEKTAALEEEDRRKDLFLATLGHELRNPLAALDLEVRLLENGVGDVERVHRRMGEHVRQLTSLVNDLLEVSRITRGKVSLRKGRTDLVAVVRSAAQAIESDLRRKSQRLVLSLPESLPVEADSTRIEQVVANLLSNACKFTPELGHVEVGVGCESGEAVIRVQDTGQGLRADQVESVFEPFVQDDPLKGGLGIGLALVRGLVELHGGTVTAGSEGPGRGARFTVRVPIGDVGEVPAPRRRRVLRTFARPVRVLLVDDNRDFADSLALLLERMGAETLCAHTGADGLQKARTWGPEAVLVDIGLPDMMGYEVARRLRASGHGEGLLLLAVTGFGDQAAEEKAREAGFDGRLVKPIDPETLQGLLRRTTKRANRGKTSSSSDSSGNGPNRASS